MKTAGATYRPVASYRERKFGLLETTPAVEHYRAWFWEGKPECTAAVPSSLFAVGARKVVSGVVAVYIIIVASSLYRSLFN